jgi:hypothetical protein
MADEASWVTWGTKMHVDARLPNIGQVGQISVRRLIALLNKHECSEGEEIIALNYKTSTGVIEYTVKRK